MKKRIISLALIFILAFSLLPTGALAASKIYDVYQGDGFYITVKPYAVKSTKFALTNGGSSALDGRFHDGMIPLIAADVDENWVNREFIRQFNYADTDGNVLFPEGIFNDTRVSDGDTLNFRGRERLVPSEGMIPFWDGKTVDPEASSYTPLLGYVDYSGKVVIPCKYDVSSIHPFSEGLSSVPGGFIDKTGRIVIDTSKLSQEKNLHVSADEFSDGLIECYMKNGDTRTEGYMDKSGNMVIKLISYDPHVASEYKRDYWKMYADGKTDGYLKPFDYSPFSDGYIVCYDLRSGNALDYNYAIIDTKGNIVGTFSDASPAGSFHDGLLNVSFIDNRGYKSGCGFVDTSGNVVRKYGNQWSANYSFSCGLLWSGDDFGGLVDTKFNIVIPKEHIGVDIRFNDNLALVQQSGQYYVLEKHEGTYTGGGSVYNHAKGGEQTNVPTKPTTPTTSTGFGDVADNAWFAAPVKWAVDKGITSGTSKTTFSPNTTCNNAQILTFLWRAAGKPGAPDAGFTDVASTAYYADAANWAKSKDMISGDKLSPETPCTRASAVMYIWQAMGKPEASKAASFTDIPAGADYADAVAWAVEKGVTNGTGDGSTFSPGTTCTRAQIVAFLQRAYA